MIASLPMYSRLETAAATDDFWTLIRNEHGQWPVHLTRTNSPWDQWRSPDLLFSQTCGLPFRLELHRHVQLIGTPDYGLDDCPPGYYCSVIVMRTDDGRPPSTHLDQLVLAYNSADSQSGWAAAHDYADHHGTDFRTAVETGSHLASAKSVAAGQADVTFIDAQSWRDIERFDSFAAALKVADRTPPVPGLPYITGPDGDPQALAGSVSRAISVAPKNVLSNLGIVKLVPIPLSAYLSLPTPAPPRFET